MAEFTIEVDQIRFEVGYDPVPSLDPGSLPVLVARQVNDYGPVTTNAPHYTSSQLVGGPYIPGGSFTVGRRYLVWVSGAMGSNDAVNNGTGAGGQPRAFVVDNAAVSPRVWILNSAKGAYNPGTGSTIPFPARNCGVSGAFIYVANGTHLELSFENRSALGECWFHDFHIVAIPLDEPGMTLDVNINGLFESDINYKTLQKDCTDALYGGVPFANIPQIVPSFDTLTDSVAPATGVYMDMVAPHSDDYLVLATCAQNNSGTTGAQSEYQLLRDLLDGSTPSVIGTVWKKNTKDQRDLFPVNLLSVQSFPANQEVVLSFQGKPNGGGVSRFGYHPRILTLRFGAFARKAHIETSSVAVPVSKLYTVNDQDWQTVAELPFTPIADTGEYVLVVGRMLAWRTDAGSMLGRIRIKETGEVIKDYVPSINTSAVDYDRSGIMLCTAKLVNTPYTYQLQVIQADGALGAGFVSDATLVVIGCTKNTGPSNSFSVTINDEVASNSVSSNPGLVGGGGTNQYGESINDDQGSTPNSNSTATYVHTPGTSLQTPAQVRPRLWFYNNDRLSYLRTRTGGSQYAAMVAKMGLEDRPMHYQYILKWKMTGLSADRNAARDKYFGAGGLFSKDIVQLLWWGDLTDSGFMYRFIMRDLALALDWFYDDNGVDVMTVANGFPSNARAMIRNAMVALTHAKFNPYAFSTIDPAIGVWNATTQRWSGGPGSYLSWANTDTHNNHFHFMMMGAAYAACSLYGEQPTTFTYKPGAASGWTVGATTYSFQIPYHIYSGNPAVYSDIWQFVIDRVENMMLPTLDVDMAGGSTEEGTNYGLSSSIFLTEMFSILKTCAGRDYLNQTSCFKDNGYFNIYSIQPGATNNVNLGDQPNDDGRALVNDRNRLLCLMVADAFQSDVVSNYLQWFMDNKIPTMGEGTYESMDFLLYRHDRPAINISALPLFYVASGTGFVNSRDSWDDTAVSVSMSACNHGEEHHHSDFGALQIYHGSSPSAVDAGWMTIDLNMLSPQGGDNWDLHNHSTHTICTSAQPNGWPQQYFGVPPVAPPPPDTAPLPPVLMTPLDGALSEAIPVAMSWLASANATSYTLQISTSLSFNSFAYNQSGLTGLSVSVPGLATGTVYYWRMSATGTGGTGVYSSILSFTTAGVVTPPGGGVKLVEDTTGLQIFPTNNWWNMDVSAWPVDTNSAAYISVLNAQVGAGGSSFPGSFWPDFTAVSGTAGIPYIGVDGTQPLVPVTWTQYGSESDNGQPGKPAGYPIPNEAKASASGGVKAGWAEQGGDNHMLIFDRDNMLLYEIYKVEWTGTQWRGSNGACFQMNTNNRRPEGWTSTDAAGLAVFPGLVKYDDLHGSGPIRHATRFACLNANGYVYPGSHVGPPNQANHHVAGWLPFGARIRLKASFDIAAFLNGFGSLSASNKTALTKLFQSWKTYGLIFADTGTHGMVQGAMDNRWVNGEFNTVFKNLRFSSFDVLELGKVGP